ncbi:hypothetical protein FHQ18_08055 [Deferribacter autotrophicus]|uniref:Uncharacterized protein n=1 Tax=Deferribacter autotrophicus TaxID=500465 RepID=A0A5A8F762_9BACT|nr:hypothetical protein [Deferribacter autotrophicus]KAA0257686.1 hypothetical protein FHQ18_08055 [Deferribacter autotrophicus]
MKDKRKLIKELEEIAQRLNISVRYEATKAKGGLCRVEDKYYIIIDKKATPEYKISVLVRSLRKLDLNNIHIKPKLREFIENY